MSVELLKARSAVAMFTMSAHGIRLREYRIEVANADGTRLQVLLQDLQDAADALALLLQPAKDAAAKKWGAP